MREQSAGRSFGLTLVLAFVAVACWAPSLAFAATAHEFESSFGADCTEGTHFAGPGPVVVDQETHDIYVADLEAGAVVRCAASGTPAEFTAGAGAGTNEIGGFSFFSEEALNQIAIDNSCIEHNPPLTELTTPTCEEFDPSNGNFYVAAWSPFGTNTIKAFQRDGEGAGEVGEFGEVSGVAVDANGDIYASDLSTGTVDVFSPNHVAITSFSAPNTCNLAVDSAAAVYVAPYHFSGLPVRKFTPSEFPLTAATTYSEAGVVDPHPAYGLAVDPSNDDLYVDEHTGIAQFEEDGTSVGTFGETGSGALTASEGVAVDGTTGNVYASVLAGERQVEIFVPPPPNPPVVGSVSANNITAISADLQAQVNPKLFKTSYHFEYLTEAEYEANGKSFSGPNLPISTSEAALGSAGTPQTARAHIGGLAPDTTYFFRVSAENENNEGSPVFNLELGEFSTFPTSPPGLPDGRAYEMVSPPQKAGEVFVPGGIGGSCVDCLPGGSNQMMPMQSAPDGESILYEGQPFSAGLASGQDEYLSGRMSRGWGTQSLSGPTTTGSYAAFSPDLSKGVLFQIEPALSPEAPTREGESYANLYLRDEVGLLQPLVTEEPPSRSPGIFGNENENAFRLAYAGANSGTASVPAFGHLIFEANDALTEEVPGIAPKAPQIEAGGAKCSFPGSNCNLYEWTDGQLRLVNVLPENQNAAVGAVIGSGQLMVGFPGTRPPDVDHAISADGSRVFWSDATGQVYVRIGGKETDKIEDSGKFVTAAADGSKVLLSDGCLYDLEAETCEKDLAQGQGEKFKGILGAADDLSHIYFVDTAVLTGGEENANKEHAIADEFNLYAWHEGVTNFIGILIETDSDNWTAARPIRTAQVSADGSYLAFISRASLTGYNNTVSGGGICGINQPEACSEVFEYASSSSSLICVSCNPTGQQPIGRSNLSRIFGFPLFPPFPQPGNLSTDGGGRLFFESQDTLSPRDTNGHIQDVYEFEPNGTEMNGVVTCKRPSGCVFLISSGHSNKDSMFLDSTPSGSDVFLVTREQLLPRDKDEQLDLYDARAPHVLGEPVGFPEGETAPCGGDACRGPIASPPVQQSAGSSEFSGPGNPTRHHKKKHKKKHKKHHKRSVKHNRGGSK